MLTIRQAAEKMGVSRRTIFRLVKSGDLPSVNVSASPKRKVWRIEPEALDAFIAKRRTQERKECNEQ